MLKNYFNLKVDPDQEIPVWDLLGKAWSEIHRAGANLGIAFAVDFPEWMQNGYSLGKTLRVFVGDTDQAGRLYDVIEENLNDAKISGRIRTVPEDVSKVEWVAYRMHRLPGPVSKNRRTIPLNTAIELRSKARERRLVQQQSLPFVRMRSSSGNQFKLVVERITTDPSQQGQPNGYGLSRTSQIIALPVL